MEILLAVGAMLITGCGAYFLWHDVTRDYELYDEPRTLKWFWLACAIWMGIMAVMFGICAILFTGHYALMGIQWLTGQ